MELGIIKVRFQDERTESWIKEVVNRLEQGYVALVLGVRTPRRNFFIEHPYFGSPEKLMELFRTCNFFLTKEKMEMTKVCVRKRPTSTWKLTWTWSLKWRCITSYSSME